MKKLIAVALLLAVVLIATPAQAQSISSAVATVQMNLSIGESISITALPASFNFQYQPATNTATMAAPITGTYVWSLATTRTKVTEYTWLGSATAALTGGGVNIPSSEVFLSMNGNPAVACTASFGPEVAGAGCPNWTGSPRSFNLPADVGYVNPGFVDSFQFSLANLPALPPTNYIGTINFEITAQ